MFTGIVESTGEVLEIEHSELKVRLVISHPTLFAEESFGASIAVNGVCLTQASHERGISFFDVVQETLDRTNLGQLKKGDLVNLERSMKLGDRIDGHLVQGHVDGVGKITKLNEASQDLWVEIPIEFEKFCVQKGSITLDGISLTIAELSESKARIAVVPTTWEITHLRQKKVGDLINIEVDMMAKYVRKYFSEYLTESLEVT